MKLVRFGQVGSEKPGVVDTDGQIRDVSSIVTDFKGSNLSPESLQKLSQQDLSALPLVDSSVRLGPPVAGSGKFICIGLNYSDHARESGMELPSEPVIFMKATSAICGANDPIIIPRNSSKTDWEVELAVVIGKRAKYVSEEDAMDYVAGYAVTNDVSEREFQLERLGNWTKGKSCDNFGQIGPWLVTKEDIADPHNLPMKLQVNGEVMQDGNSNTMVYKIPFLISYLSQFMSLQPGDIISTGTPPGVGLGFNPPKYLKVGDVVEVEIEGLGYQRQEVINDEE